MGSQDYRFSIVSTVGVITQLKEVRDVFESDFMTVMGCFDEEISACEELIRPSSPLSCLPYHTEQPEMSQ